MGVAVGDVGEIGAKHNAVLQLFELPESVPGERMQTLDEVGEHHSGVQVHAVEARRQVSKIRVFGHP